MLLPALLGNCDKLPNQPTSERRGHRKVPIKELNGGRPQSHRTQKHKGCILVLIIWLYFFIIKISIYGIIRAKL